MTSADPWLVQLSLNLPYDGCLRRKLRDIKVIESCVQNGSPSMYFKQHDNSLIF